MYQAVSLSVVNGEAMFVAWFNQSIHHSFFVAKQVFNHLQG